MDKAGISEAAGGQPGAGQLTEETAASRKVFRCGWLRRLLPLAYREELYHVIRMTGPLFISRILNFLLPFVNTIFCGHLGNAELAGYALASAVLNCITVAMGFGLALACDTLISQTFGSGNLKRVGEILQRSTLVLLLFCMPCWAILINAETILLAMRQEPEVARITQLYVMICLPAVPAMFLHQLQVSYLQNQGIILPQMYTAAATNVINIAINYILISVMQLGVKGSAAASSLSEIIQFLLLFGYIHWKQLHVKTWGGWSSVSLQEWGSFMQLVVPSTLMLCFEWWLYEIGSFLAGMFGEVELSAGHIVLEMDTIAFMMPLGIHAAVCVRVGNALGAGDEAQALITCKVGLALSSAVAVFQGIVIAITKSFIGYIFTTDTVIVVLVSKVLTLFIFLQVFEALVCVSHGILVGAGKQKIVAVFILISYYGVGLPVGIALMFKACLGILGMWLGFFLSVILQACLLLTLIFKLDWRKAAEEAQKRAGKISKAQKRAGKISKVTCTGQKPPIAQSEVDTLVPEGPETPENSPDVGATTDAVGTCQKEKGYAVVSTEDQGRLESGKDAGSDPTPSPPTPAPLPPPRLSVSQLVLRRGLALLVAILSLVVGVVMHLQYRPEVFHSQFGNWTLGNSSANQNVPYNCTAPF